MKGIVLIGEDEVIESRAKRAKLPVAVVEALPQCLPDGWAKGLIVQAGTRVPFDLLPAAWHFLDAWDAAVPMWHQGVTAADVGTAEEREITRGVVGDLRVLLHSVELLFIRNSEQGQELLATFYFENEPGGEMRLAFLRALHVVKPRLCLLPTSWLAEVQQWRGAGEQGSRGAGVRVKSLVMIELEPGRLVKVREGDEAKVRAAFEQQRKGR